jgi:hypothetical protein
MATGPAMAYDMAGLRIGADGMRVVGDRSEAALGVLRSAPMESGMFGLTAAAAAYAAVLESVRTARFGGLEQEGQRADDLAGRVVTAGSLGDGLTERSATIARSATPRVQ